MSIEHQALANGLEQLLKLKLEEKVNELLNLPKGQTDRNLPELLRIAKENGFRDEQFYLEEMLKDIGLAFMQSAQAPKKTKNSHEKELQDYLIADTHLTRIEPGLSYVNHEVDVESGRLDIKAHDKNNKSVTLELKGVKDYDPADTFHQIRKYMNNQKDDRVMFVAPFINPHLFWSLKELLDAGRIEFYTATKEGESYSFTKIDETNVPKPAKLRDLVTNGKKRKESDRIKIPTRKAPSVKEKLKSIEECIEIVNQIKKESEEQESIIIKDKDQNQEGSEEEWLAKQPFYYRVLAPSTVAFIDRPGAHPLKHYQKSIIITAAQRKNLESLMMPHALKLALETYETDLLGDYEQLEDILEAEPQRRERAFTLLDSLMPDFFDLQPALQTIKDVTSLVEDLCKKGPDAMVETAENIVALSTKYINTIMKVMRQKKNIHACVLLRNSAMTDRGIHGSETQHADAYSWINAVHRIQYHNEAYLTKAMRVLALAKIDLQLAWGYAAYNELSLPIPENSSRRNHDIRTKRDGFRYIKGFLEDDTTLYESFLTILQAPKPEEAVAPKLSISPLEPKISTSPQAQSLYNILITEENVSAFSDEMKASIQCFAEDIEGRISYPKKEQLAKTFSQWNLAKKMRKREEAPTDLKIRNFFDDVMLKYIRKGIIPSESELEATYQKA